MEDAHLVRFKVSEFPFISVFGVFDGHGGSEVAKYVERHFIELLTENPAFKEKQYETALSETFL